MTVSDESEPSPVTAETLYQAVTANRLTDGVPIYFTETEGWSTRVADAAASQDGTALLARAASAVSKNEAVGAMLIDVTPDGDAIRPVSLREQIRAFGPTA